MLLDIQPKLRKRQDAVAEPFTLRSWALRYRSIAAITGPWSAKVLSLFLFVFTGLDPMESCGQVYILVKDIDRWHHAFHDAGVRLLPKEQPEHKPWGQREFALLDPDRNLLTFGQEV